MVKKKNRVIRVGFAILIFLILIGFVEFKLNQVYEKEEQSLDTGWTIEVQGQEYNNIALSTFKFPKIYRGDQVLLTREMEEKALKQNTLRFMTRYSAIKVYLNDEMIYEKGGEYLDQGKILGNGYCWLEFPDYIGEGELKIILTASEDNAFATLEGVVLMDSSQIFAWLVSKQLLTLIVACFLFAMGIISIMGYIAVGYHAPKMGMLLWLGLFSVEVSMWMICNSRLLQVLTNDLHIVCITEYLSMYTAFVSLLCFVTVFIQDDRKKKIFRTLAWAFTALELVLVILNVTGIAHFPRTIHIFQLFAFLAILMVVFILWKEQRHSERVAEKIFTSGIVCFVIFVGLELIRYRYNKIVVPAYELHQSMIPIGATIFVLAMFGSFIYRMMERVAENMERKTLYDMAYQDALTGIRNRAWCEKVMEDYEKTKRPFSIINMDLNSFKEINDHLGHAVGDEVLIHFAKILSSVFREQDCVGRMGGDEFVVILDCVSDDIIEEHMKRLETKILEVNKNNKGSYQISVSYGYASAPEGTEQSPWKIYEQSDRNMYEFKEKVKKI